MNRLQRGNQLVAAEFTLVHWMRPTLIWGSKKCNSSVLSQICKSVSIAEADFYSFKADLLIHISHFDISTLYSSSVCFCGYIDVKVSPYT